MWSGNCLSTFLISEMTSLTSTQQTAKTIFTFRILLGITCLGTACVSLDHILQLPAVATSHYYRAAVDNFTHGLVGLLSWAIVIGAVPPINCWQLGEIILCGVLSSILDADHFIAAKSIYLQVWNVLTCTSSWHTCMLFRLKEVMGCWWFRGHSLLFLYSYDESTHC